MTGSTRRQLIHAAVGVATAAAGALLLTHLESQFSRLGVLLLVYALGAGAWAFGAVWNQRDYQRHPRRPYVNELCGMVGAEGVAITLCNPRGWIRIEGETWQAAASGTGIAAGAAVRVVRATSLILDVEPVAHADGLGDTTKRGGVPSNRGLNDER